MKSCLTLLFLLLFVTKSHSQNSSDSIVKRYAEGIYDDKEDFIEGFPSRTVSIDLHVSDSGATELIGRGYFEYSETGKKLKNVFAISYEGNLYFQTGHITLPRNRNKKDKDQTSWTIGALHEFNRVIFMTAKFAYTEVILKSGWETGLAVNVGGRVYGYKKPVVWDYQNNEFNILRNCKDHNDFMAQNYPNGIQICAGKSYDLTATRASIMSIK